MWKNVDFNYDYGGSDSKKRVPESSDIPITLLNAIGVSVLSSFDKWLSNLQTGGDSKKKKPAYLWSEARVVRKVLPVTEVSSKETIGEKRIFQPAVPHDSSCFCGCRGLRTMTTNSTTRL